MSSASEFELPLSTNKALASLKKLKAGFTATMGNASKSIVKMTTGASKGLSNVLEGMENIQDETVEAADRYKKLTKVISELEDTVKDLNETQEAGSEEEKAATKERLADLQKTIKLQKTLQKEAQGAMTGVTKGGKKVGAVGRAMNWRSGPQGKVLKEQTGKMGSDFKNAVSSFFSKDAKGVFENALKGSGRALGIGFGAASIGLGKGGQALKERGRNTVEAGKARGGFSGAGQAAAGYGMKGIGTAMGGISKVVAPLAKLGPVLTMAGSAMAALIKLFIDAEAQAKEFQKDVLSSASTVEFLAQQGWHAESAYDSLNDTLSQIRDSAHSFRNLSMGIKAEDHKAVINTLTQEGVTLVRIAREAEVAGKSVGQFATEMTHMSVVYSRSFGVPLAEINQLQAEMMTEMGQSLESTRLSFSRMTREATESGMAANKFFGIIKSVTSDLTMYNTRMDTAVKILGLLNKAMSPKNAQKFMSMATQGLKAMSQDDRLKLALLAGPASDKMVKRNIERRTANLAKDIGEAIGMNWEEVRDKMGTKEGADEIWKTVATKAPEKLGALRESRDEIRMDKEAAGKGVYGKAFAMENLDIGESLEVTREAIKGWGGGNSLMEGAGSLGMTKIAEMLGKSTQDLRGMIKLEMQVERKRAEMMEGASPEEQAKIQKMGMADIIDSMSADEKGELEKQAKTEEDFAKKQADLTSSMLDKLATLVEFVMNQLYNILQDTWGVVWDMLGGTETMIALIAELVDIGSNKYGKAAGRAAMGVGGLISAFSQKTEKSKENSKEAREAERSIRSEVAASSDPLKKAALERATKDGRLDTEHYGRLVESGEKERQFQSNSKAFSEMIDVVKGSGSLGGALSGIGDVMMGAGADPATQSKEDFTKFWDAEAQKNQAAAATGTWEEIKEFVHHAVGMKNSVYVRFGKNFLNNEFSTAMEKSVLEALRVALFEYYMYSGIEDRASVANYLKNSGTSIKAFAEGAGTAATEGVNIADALTANAAGGLVTGVNGGLAMVTAAAGEGLASVGRGERIVPAGGGGSGAINLYVNGLGGNDLAQFLKGYVIDGIADYKRRERMT